MLKREVFEKRTYVKIYVMDIPTFKERRAKPRALTEKKNTTQPGELLLAF